MKIRSNKIEEKRKKTESLISFLRRHLSKAKSNDKVVAPCWSDPPFQLSGMNYL